MASDPRPLERAISPNSTPSRAAGVGDPPIARRHVVADEADAKDDVPPHVRRLVWLLAALSLAAFLGVAAVGPTAWPSWGRLAALIAFGTLTLADGTYIHLGRRRVRISFSFSEIGVLVILVFLPGAAAVAAIALSSVIYEVIARRTPIKGVFNVAQHALGATAGALVLQVLPPLGVAVGGVSLVSASIAVLVYVLVTVVLWLLLLQQLMGSVAVWDELAATVGVDAVASLASVSVAVIAVYLWDSATILLVYAAVPLMAVLVAYRYLRLSQHLVQQRSADAESLRRLVSSTTDGIVMLGGDDQVEVWNPVMEALTGVAATDAEGRGLDELMSQVPRRAGTALGEAREAVAEWRDGRILEEHTSRVRSPEEDDAGRVIVLRDVTRQQEAEQLKSDFVARVSHELRTPLTPISGFIELLRDRSDGFDPAMTTTVLDAMRRNTERMTALVDELLLVVELDRGELRHSSATVELTRVAAAAYDRLVIDVTDHRIDLDVPPGTIAVADEERLVEVIRHLLDNAVRYSPAGTTVRLSATREDGEVAIRVTDEGPGIPHAARELVFERFSRLEGPLQMRTSGLGLGLFVARRLSESMGGTLTIAATGPSGTTMEVRLPRELDPAR